MVDDALWQGVADRWKIPADAHGDVGMICVNCFEQLLGRKLTKDDFSDAEINHLDCEWNLRSDRLCDRLTVD
jgi:hypothetical protein